MSIQLIHGADQYKQPDGTYILEDGQIILPEEFDFYDDLADDGPVDWYADETYHNISAASKLVKVSPSEWTEFAVKIPVEGIPLPYSFMGRRYLKTPYDIHVRRLLLMCGRQVEKTVSVSSLIPLYSGELVEAIHIKLGDVLASFDGQKCGSGKVTWVSDVYRKKGYRITTRQGHTLELGHEHPLKTFTGWIKAEDCKVGDRIAVVRRSGSFTNEVQKPDEEIEIVAVVIGDGCIKNGTITGLPGLLMERMKECFGVLGWSYRTQKKEGTTAYDIRIHKKGKDAIIALLDGKINTSTFKEIPSWVFKLDKRQTALFLNRLWATDGHVKHTKSRWSIEYCSASQLLIRQVQSLLWKFGIPSKIRKNWPNYWKSQGIKKYAYILRVETLTGVRSFLDTIGAMGKTDHIIPPDSNSRENNNRDTIPKDVEKLIQAIHRSWPDAPSLFRPSGFRLSLKYPPTQQLLKNYVDFFRQFSEYDQSLVDNLAEYSKLTDLFWDEITEIEELSELECIDFCVDPHHTFIADGFITHNSTLLGNSILARMCIAPHFRALYVSPTHEQTKVFRRDRIGEPIALSEILQAYISASKANNMSLIKFVNFSQLTLRYAYLSADRVRGIPADAIYIDEIQDILTDNIPVIEECAAHANPIFKSFTYSGTPKSFDNTIEHLWSKRSTQNEWAVPCTCRTIMDMGAGTAKSGNSPSFWNVPLVEENMGLNSLICVRCGKPIDPASDYSRWVSMNAAIRKHPRLDPFEGFRIPQLMVPWVSWKDLLNKRESYSRSRFYNEVLAMSFDSGNRPLRMDDLMRNSIPTLTMENESLYDIQRGVEGLPVFMGIDWGCHDEETRILTTDGFKYFRELTDDDEVAQFDKDTRLMSFVKPQVRTVREWHEPLLHFRSRQVDTLVTPTHRMLFKGRQAVEWSVKTAGDVVSKKSPVKFRGYVKWEGEPQQWFTLPGLPTSPGYSGSEDKRIPMNLWLEIMGYLVTEGGVCHDSSGRPSCVKMSQRMSVNEDKMKSMGAALEAASLNFKTFYNEVTTDVNWTIYGKQIWSWVVDNLGEYCQDKKLPRWVFRLPVDQLTILFHAMVAGDGTRDQRNGCTGGGFYSTSRQLCEDFQELCIRLGLRAVVSLHKEVEGNKQERWRVSWSAGKDYTINDPSAVERVEYSGNVYCCKVPTGFIVTERHGRISYQGNTGEGTYSVMCLGTYLYGHSSANDKFYIFYWKRYTGPELDPELQLKDIIKTAELFRPTLIGADYGGGFDRNKKLMNTFGPQRFVKYQYIGGHRGASKRSKIEYDSKKGRYLIDRTEVMSDIFNAIKDNKFAFPRWEDWADPFASDMLSIFSEYSEVTRMIRYDKSPNGTDDSFHAALYCFLASYIRFPRPDIMRPLQESPR